MIKFIRSGIEWLIGPKPLIHDVSTAMSTGYGGMSKELIYFSFLDGAKLITTHGSMMVAFEFRGHDLSGSVDEELNKVSFELNAAIRELGEGWSLHIDVIRQSAQEYIPDEKSAFAHPTSHLVDLERKQFYQDEGNHYENKFIINFCWLMPRDVVQKINNMLFIGNRDELVRQLGLDNALDMHLGEFDIKLNKLLTTISNVFPYFKQLNEDDYMMYLNRCINGEVQKVNIPENGIFLQVVLGNKDLIVENYPKIGKKYIRTIGVYGIDAKVAPGMMDVLNSMDVEFRFNSRYIFLNAAKSKKAIEAYIEKHKLKRKSLIRRMLSIAFKVATEDSEYAMQQELEAKSNLPIVESGQANLGYYTNTFVLMGEDLRKLDIAANYIYGILKQLGFSAQIEDINNVEAYFGSLPGYTFENVVQLPVFTHQLCNMLPITGIWSGADQCPNPLYALNGGNTPVLAYAQTSGATPFKVNFAVKDNSNVLMVGDSPTFINFIAMQFDRYKRSKVFIFDQDYNSYVTCHAMDGTHIELIKNDAKIGMYDDYIMMQPLANIDKIGELAWAEKWLLDIYELHTDKPAGIEIVQAIKNVLNLLADDRPENRTMSVLVSYLVDATDGKLRDIYKYYTEGVGAMLDGSTETIHTSNFTVFEIKNLLSLNESKIIVPVLTYLFHKIEITLTGSPALIIIPRLYQVIKHDIFLRKLEEWLYEIRKKGVTLWLASDNIKALLDSRIASSLISECQTKIFSPNYAAGTDELYLYYQRFGLNAQQIQIIVEMIEKKHYYMTAGRDKRVFELGLEYTPITQAFSSKYNEDEVKTAKEILSTIKLSTEKVHFATEWLKYHDTSIDGINAWQELSNKLYN